MSTQAYDVVVVGAGIVGAACALECAQRGLQVALVDRDLVAAGATGAAMGHIVVMDDSEAQFVLTRYSQQLWQEFQAELPAEVEYQQRGTIWIAADDEDMAEVGRKQAYYQARNVPAEVLDAVALQQAEPNLRKGLLGGLFVPQDCVLDPASAARFLAGRAQSAGALAFLGCAVSKIGLGVVELANGIQFSAPKIVNAAGVGAQALTPGLGIKMRKGHLLMTERYPDFARHQLVELGYLKSAHSIPTDSVAFNVQPRKNGQVLVGSSRQYDAEHPEIDAPILDRMQQRAQQYMPRLAQLKTARVWTGFRAATVDKLPLLGPYPEDETVLLATGHEGLGITTSLASGRLIADHITGVESFIPATPYLPSRNLKGVHQ
jgi:glycine/D-amino acid oxidase-like deaminating enzyme